MYRGSRETSLCLLWRVSSSASSNSSQSIGVHSSTWLSGFSVVEEGRRAASEAFKVLGCIPVSVARRTKSGYPTLIEFPNISCVNQPTSRDVAVDGDGLVK